MIRHYNEQGGNMTLGGTKPELLSRLDDYFSTSERRLKEQLPPTATTTCDKSSGRGTKRGATALDS